jgi:hypothetical protein
MMQIPFIFSLYRSLYLHRFTFIAQTRMHARYRKDRYENDKSIVHNRSSS